MRTFCKSLLVLLLMTVLLAGAFSSAMAAPEMYLMQITLSWTDAGGEEYFYQAEPMPGSDCDFWITVGPSAPFPSLTLRMIEHPEYPSFTCIPGADSPITVFDCEGVKNPDLAYPVTVMNGANEVAMLYLYVSSLPWDGTTSAQPGRETSAPQWAPYAEIPVIYQTDNGIILDQRTVTCASGQTTVVRAESAAAYGYELLNDDTVYVTVDANGHADRQNVTFMYRQRAAREVSFSIIYQLENGAMLDVQTQSCMEGSNATVYPASAAVSNFQLISDKSVTVYVDGEGNVNPREVVFVYREMDINAVVTVQYQTSEGAVFDVQKVNCPAGENTVIRANSNPPEGYQLTGSDTQTVWVDAQGYPSQSLVTFVYSKVQTVVPEAEVTVLYLTEDGRLLDEDHITCYYDKLNYIEPISPLVSGYELIGSDFVQVTVSKNGIANPNSVTFTYRVPQSGKTARVHVLYTDESGKEIAASQWLELAEGGHNVAASPANLPAGYSIKSNPNEFVEVSGGIAYPDTVVFVYRQNQVPAATAEILIHYQDADTGSALAWDEIRQLTGGGDITVVPDSARIPSGYSIVGTASVRVNVTAEGRAVPGEVTFSFRRRIVETPIPAGTAIQRYGKLNNKSVGFRRETNTSNGTLIRRLDKDTYVYLLEELRGTDGKLWYRVVYNGVEGYIQSDYVDMLSGSENEVYMSQIHATHIPVGTNVPVVTSAPTEAPYTGYGLIQRTVNLQTDAGSGSGSVIQILQPMTLVTVEAQMYRNGTSWSSVYTLDGVCGFVPTSAVTKLTDQEAQPYIDIWMDSLATPVPTVWIPPTATPEPVQQAGYALTITNNVPFRAQPGDSAGLMDLLPANVVVYVSGQTWMDGVCWHTVQHQERWGAIRGDHLRFLSYEETRYYLNSQTTTNPPVTATPEPAMSNYGFVTTDKVNFRATPSLSGQKLMTLNTYALCNVLDKVVSGTDTWYHVRYNGQEGYILGSFFNYMTRDELSSFLQDGRLQLGQSNNASAVMPEVPDQGSSNSSGGIWVNPSQTYVPTQSYAPFEPIATIAPIVTEAPTATPTAAPTYAPVSRQPLPTWYEEPPTANDGFGSLLAIIGAIAGIGIIGGCAYGWSVHKRNERLKAQREARRRAQAAAAQREAAARAAYERAERHQNTGVYQSVPARYTPVSGEQQDRNEDRWSDGRNIPNRYFSREYDSRTADQENLQQTRQMTPVQPQQQGSPAASTRRRRSQNSRSE